MEEGNDYWWDDRKKYMKKSAAFELVADQTGKLFDPNVFTIVWARRFAGYKRASLLTRDMDRFNRSSTIPNIPYRSSGPASPIPWIIRRSMSSITWYT
jgi:starch phosphorylase